MRVMVIGGTTFIGRRIVERLVARGDGVLVVHRGSSTPEPWVAVQHLLCDRRALADRDDALKAFSPDAVVDTYALTARDVETVPDRVAALPAVVLSSQDVYEATTGLRTGRDVAPVPFDEESQVRSERHPYRGLGIPASPRTTRSSTSKNVGSPTMRRSCGCRSSTVPTTGSAERT